MPLCLFVFQRSRKCWCSFTPWVIQQCICISWKHGKFNVGWNTIAFSCLCWEGVIRKQFCSETLKGYRCNMSISLSCHLSFTLLLSSPIIQSLIMLHFKGAERGVQNPQVNINGITCFHIPFVLSVFSLCNGEKKAYAFLKRTIAVQIFLEFSLSTEWLIPFWMLFQLLVLCNLTHKETNNFTIIIQWR